VGFEFDYALPIFPEREPSPAETWALAIMKFVNTHQTEET
jgi:hypothetical protein